jgi:hypothetical protein
MTYTETRDSIKNVDWIVVFGDLVLLVEAKANPDARGDAGGRRDGLASRVFR